MANKPFHQLTTDEATDLARNCKLGAQSKDEIRRRLIEAGFNGEAAALTATSHSSSGMTVLMAMGMVYGLNGEVISF